MLPQPKCEILFRAAPCYQIVFGSRLRVSRPRRASQMLQGRREMVGGVRQPTRRGSVGAQGGATLKAILSRHREDGDARVDELERLVSKLIHRVEVAELEAVACRREMSTMRATLLERDAAGAPIIPTAEPSLTTPPRREASREDVRADPAADDSTSDSSSACISRRQSHELVAPHVADFASSAHPTVASPHTKRAAPTGARDDLLFRHIAAVAVQDLEYIKRCSGRAKHLNAPLHELHALDVSTGADGSSTGADDSPVGSPASCHVCEPGTAGAAATFMGEVDADGRIRMSPRPLHNGYRRHSLDSATSGLGFKPRSH